MPLRRSLLFFAGALVFTALCQAPAILDLRAGLQPGGLTLLLLAIGSCGPTIVAAALSALEGGRAGVRDLFRRRGHMTGALALIALFHPLVAHRLAGLALAALGHPLPPHLVYLPLTAQQLAIAVLAPLGEEYGWRAYALPRLQAVMRPLPAALVVGVFWALWHLPTFFAPGAEPADLFRTLPIMLAGSVVYTWLYDASGGNMPLLLLAHLGAHLDNVFRAVALGDGRMPLYGTSAVLVLFAAGLVATGRLREPARLDAGLGVSFPA